MVWPNTASEPPVGPLNVLSYPHCKSTFCKIWEKYKAKISNASSVELEQVELLLAPP